MGDTEGHLFVVRGRLEAVSCEAVLIPTDGLFSVRPTWRAAAGLAAGERWDAVRPAGWGTGSGPSAPAPLRGWRAGTQPPQVWFADVIAPDPAAVGAVARAALEPIARTFASWESTREPHHRALPLVALPVLGTGGGGHDGHRGELVKALVASLTRAAHDLRLDLVLVAASAADYSAIQHARLDQRTPTHLDDPQQERAARGLGRRAARGELALFLGAGVSLASGLPTWSGLLEQLAERPTVKDALGDISPQNLTGELEKAELLQVVLHEHGQAHARRGAAAVGGHSLLGKEVADLITDVGPRPSLVHTILASLGVSEAATTNYDRLYEQAVTAAAGGRPTAEKASDGTATHQDDVRAHVSVLPWDRVTPGRPWVVKMHGDVEHPESIVLSRSAFVHYDARWRPIGGLVQGLMLTRHLLVVGASLTDDNLLRLAHEVTHLTDALQNDGNPNGQPQVVGTVLTVEDDPAFKRLWKDRFDVVGMGGRRSSDPWAVRGLSLFLDAVGRYAEPVAAHLLDARYTPATQPERDAARSLLRGAGRARKLAGTTGTAHGWRHVADTLGALGAQGDPTAG